MSKKHRYAKYISLLLLHFGIWECTAYSIIRRLKLEALFRLKRLINIGDVCREVKARFGISPGPLACSLWLEPPLSKAVGFRGTPCSSTLQPRHRNGVLSSGGSSTALHRSEDLESSRSVVCSKHARVWR